MGELGGPESKCFPCVGPTAVVCVLLDGLGAGGGYSGLGILVRDLLRCSWGLSRHKPERTLLADEQSPLPSTRLSFLESQKLLLPLPLTPTGNVEERVVTTGLQGLLLGHCRGWPCLLSHQNPFSSIWLKFGQGVLPGDHSRLYLCILFPRARSAADFPFLTFPFLFL